jgi:hypothetical protein
MVVTCYIWLLQVTSVLISDRFWYCFQAQYFQVLLFRQFSFASSLKFLQFRVFLITASILFKIGYTCSFFQTVDSIKDYLAGTLYWEVHLIFYRFHTSYIWLLRVGAFMVFKQMLVLLSGRLSSNTAVPACFGSAFKSDKYRTAFKSASGSCFLLFQYWVEQRDLVGFHCTVLLLWFTSDNFMISCH